MSSKPGNKCNFGMPNLTNCTVFEFVKVPGTFELSGFVFVMHVQYASLLHLAYERQAEIPSFFKKKLFLFYLIN